MTFLAPAFLLALGMLAVPIVIHLIQRERKNLVRFPSLMFLRRIPYPSVRRRKIRNWLLLMLRMAALTLIVLAFARPFLTRPELAASAAAGPRELVILLDHSYSMGYGDRWARAQAAARRVAETVGPADRATLVLFGTGAEVLVRSTPDRPRLLAAIGESAVSADATRLGPALKLALSTLASSQLPRREVVLISDFQKSAWQKADAVRLPAGYVLTPVPIADSRTANVAVTGVNLERSTFSGQERITATAALLNRGPDPAEIEAVLDLDGRAIQTHRLRVEANAPATVTFAPFTLSGETRGAVRLTDDALAYDNAFYFAVGPGRPVPVLVLERGASASDASFFLLQALRIGNAPTFEVAVAPIEQAGPSQLRSGFAAGGSSSGAGSQGPAVVILNDVGLASGALADAMQGFVEQGGGLLAVAGERSAWSDRAAAFLPGRLGPAVDRIVGRGAVLDVVDDGHPVFELFKGPLAAGFSSARFFRYRALDLPSPNQTEGPPVAAEAPTVLARFDDRAVALVERKVGQGLVIVWTSTLDTFWNDLALKPVFLPFVQRIVAHLAQYRDRSPWLKVGQVADAEAARRELAGGGVRASARGEVEFIQAPSGRRVTTPSSVLVELREAGFYEARFRREERPVVIASNVDTAESDLTAMDPQELVAAVAAPASSETAVAGGGARGDEALNVPLEIQERQQAMWWYLLLAGIVLLATETILSNRISRATS